MARGGPRGVWIKPANAPWIDLGKYVVDVTVTVTGPTADEILADVYDLHDELERDRLARARAQRQTNTLTTGNGRATRIVRDPLAATEHARASDPTSILDDETGEDGDSDV